MMLSHYMELNYVGIMPLLLEIFIQKRNAGIKKTSYLPSIILLVTACTNGIIFNKISSFTLTTFFYDNDSSSIFY